MSRLIFIFIIFALVYWLLTSYRRQAPKQDVETKPQDMVSCAFCGIHLPKGESVKSAGKYYCCAAHSRGLSD
ncbi:MAG: PP0621 family protein [Gallionellaceae bacterium]|jgi:uncharacterized protein